MSRDLVVDSPPDVHSTSVPLDTTGLATEGFGSPTQSSDSSRRSSVHMVPESTFSVPPATNSANTGRSIRVPQTDFPLFDSPDLRDPANRFYERQNEFEEVLLDSASEESMPPLESHRFDVRGVAGDLSPFHPLTPNHNLAPFLSTSRELVSRFAFLTNPESRTPRMFFFQFCFFRSIQTDYVRLYPLKLHASVVSVLNDYSNHIAAHDEPWGPAALMLAKAARLLKLHLLVSPDADFDVFASARLLIPYAPPAFLDWWSVGSAGCTDPLVATHVYLSVFFSPLILFGAVATSGLGSSAYNPLALTAMRSLMNYRKFFTYPAHYTAGICRADLEFSQVSGATPLASPSIVSNYLSYSQLADSSNMSIDRHFMAFSSVNERAIRFLQLTVLVLSIFSVFALVVIGVLVFPFSPVAHTYVSPTVATVTSFYPTPLTVTANLVQTSLSVATVTNALVATEYVTVAPTTVTVSDSAVLVRPTTVYSTVTTTYISTFPLTVVTPSVSFIAESPIVVDAGLAHLPTPFPGVSFTPMGVSVGLLGVLVLVTICLCFVICCARKGNRKD